MYMHMLCFRQAVIVGVIVICVFPMGLGPWVARVTTISSPFVLGHCRSPELGRPMFDQGRPAGGPAAGDGFVAQEDKNNIGILLCPVFSYKKGNLWLTEHGLTQGLVAQGPGVDKKWSLLLGKKTVHTLNTSALHMFHWLQR